MKKKNNLKKKKSVNFNSCGYYGSKIEISKKVVFLLYRSHYMHCKKIKTIEYLDAGNVYQMRAFH